MLRAAITVGLTLASAITWDVDEVRVRDLGDRPAGAGAGAADRGNHESVEPLVFITGAPYLQFGIGVDAELMRVSGFELGFIDIDGDGAPDHVLKSDPAEGDDSRRAEKVFVRRNRMSGTNLLKAVHGPLGGSMKLSYRRAGNTVDLPENHWVLDTVTVDDGTHAPGKGHIITTQWRFDGGRYDRAERELLGFSTVTQLNADKSEVIRRFDTSGFDTKGLLLTEEVRDQKGRLFSGLQNFYRPQSSSRLVAVTIDSKCAASTPFFLAEALYCGSFFRALEKSEQYFYEGQTDVFSKPLMTSRQRYTYDGAGNVSDFFDDGDVADPADDLTAHVDYAPAKAGESYYFPGQAVGIEVNAVASGKLLRQRSATLDGQGNVVALSAFDGQRIATSRLTWAHGMLASVTTPPNHAGDTYRVEYEYDKETGTWPVKSTDDFGYSSTARYDLRFGEVTRTVDLNNQVTTRELDELGRATSVTGPQEQALGRPTVKSYRLSGVPLAYTENLLPDGTGARNTLDVVVFADGLGRVRQTKTTAEVAHGAGTRLGMSVSGALGYDVMGRVVSRAQPGFVAGTPNPVLEPDGVASAFPSLFEYDVLGRTTQAREPNANVTGGHADTFISYTVAVDPGTMRPALKVKTTDALGHERGVYRDVQGRVTSVEEVTSKGRPVTRYEYNPLGELEGVVDAAGNRTSMKYDLLGRRTSLHNPDTGETFYVYDLAGNLISKLTAELAAPPMGPPKPIEYKYQRNRLTDVVFPFSTKVHYSYGGPGAPHHGAGRVVQVDDESGAELRQYGQLGELTRQTRRLKPLLPGQGVAEYSLDFEWDSFGRMLSVRYPDDELLVYTYDRGGLLKSATGKRPWNGEEEKYLADARYDVFGQRKALALGNGSSSAYQYEPDTRRLHALNTTLHEGTAIQQLVYGYDAVGNVLNVGNHLSHVLGPKFGGASGYEFHYDELNRLTAANGGAESRPGVLDRFSATYSYSDIHNLTRVTLSRSVQSQLGLEHPPAEQRDEQYDYAPGGPPHQAVRIGSLSLEYDKNGNTVHECEGANCPPGLGHDFVWSEENWLKEARKSGRVTRFLYDADGQRVVKYGLGGPTVTVGQWWSTKGNSHATKHIFAGSSRVATKVLSPSNVQRLPGSPSGGSEQVGNGWPNSNGCVPSQEQPQKCPQSSSGGAVGGFTNAVVRPATYYYHPDHLGSTQWLSADNGRLYERVEYYPYGEVWWEAKGNGGTQKLNQAFLYTGKEFDEETGLTYFGARYYDSRRARWISPDPAMLSRSQAQPVGPLSLAAYAYGWWNPIKLRDPDGEDVYLMIWGRRPATKTEAAQFGHASIGVTQFDSTDVGGRGMGARGVDIYGLFPRGTGLDNAAVAAGLSVRSTGEPTSSLKERDVSSYQSREGRVPDAVVVLRTSPAQDKEIKARLERDKGADYSVGNNCADFCVSALKPLGLNSSKPRETKTFEYGASKTINLSTPKALFETVTGDPKISGLNKDVKVEVVKSPGASLNAPMPHEVVKE